MDMNSLISLSANSIISDSLFYATKFMGFGWAQAIMTIVAAAIAAAASVYAGMASYEASKKQSKMIQADKEMRKKERAEKTRKLAGEQRASFLASGISLTGEGTAEAMLGETYDFGKEEVANIDEYYSKRQEQVLAKGRTDYNLGLLAGVSGVATSFAMNMGKGNDTAGYKPKKVEPKARTMQKQGASGVENTEGYIGL